MYDDLLVVFSNYNGMRTVNDITDPRILVTIESFQKNITNYKDVNVLLLDNNSTDGSDDLMESIADRAGDKWSFKKKYKEDFYLGTLYHLLNEYKDKFKYIMIVDNDQYFIRSGFIDTIIDVLSDSENSVIQLHETTEGDALDSHNKKDNVAGFFDKVFISGNKDICLRTHDFGGDVEGFTRLSKEQGSGMVNIRKNINKRVCWQWFGYSNVAVNINKILQVFNDKKLSMPYVKNADRLALFSSSVRKTGRTVFLESGASINFGFRKYIKSDFKIRELLDKYEKGCVGWHADDRYSFFVEKGKLRSIEKEIKNVKEKNKL